MLVESASKEVVSSESPRVSPVGIGVAVAELEQVRFVRIGFARANEPGAAVGLAGAGQRRQQSPAPGAGSQ